MAYKKQRNKCILLLKKAKKSYFRILNPSIISDNKYLWKAIKPSFSKQAMSTNSIATIENNVITNEDKMISEVFNSVKHLNIEPYELLF